MHFSQIIQNTGLDPEKKLLTQYNVGKYGSDHAHAAIGIFIEEKQQNRYADQQKRPEFLL